MSYKAAKRFVSEAFRCRNEIDVKDILEYLNLSISMKKGVLMEPQEMAISAIKISMSDEDPEQSPSLPSYACGFAIRNYQATPHLEAEVNPSCNEKHLHL